MASDNVNQVNPAGVDHGTPAGNRRAESSNELGVHCDLGVQELGNGAVGFCRFCRFLELGRIGTRNGHEDIKMTRSHGEPARNLLQGDGGSGLDFLRGEASLTQDHGEGHGEAAGMRRSNQFLRVGAFLSFKPGGERVGRGVEDAGFRREGAFAVFEAAVPDRRCFTLHKVILKRIPMGDQVQLFADRVARATAESS